MCTYTCTYTCTYMLALQLAVASAVSATCRRSVVVAEQSTLDAAEDTTYEDADDSADVDAIAAAFAHTNGAACWRLADDDAQCGTYIQSAGSTELETSDRS